MSGGGGTPLNKLTLSIICAIALSTTANAKHVNSNKTHSSGPYNDNETYIFGKYPYYHDLSTVEDKENRIPGLNFGDDIKVGTFIDSGATLTIDGKGTVWEDKIGRTLLSGVGKNNDGTLNITNGAKFITKDLHLGLDTFKIIKDPVYYTEEEFGGHYTNMIKEKGIIEYVPAMSRAIINVEGENSTLKADNIESIIVKKMVILLDMIV